MLKATITPSELEDAVTTLCRKTGMSPQDVIKAFDGLVLMGIADKRKVDKLKRQLDEINPNLFH